MASSRRLPSGAASSAGRPKPRRPSLPGTFTAAFHALTYYARRSMSSDYDRALDFVRHLGELVADHPLATLRRLAMPDGLDCVGEFLRIHQHPGDDSVVNEVYVPFLATVTHIGVRYDVGARDPLSAIVQELFDLGQFFGRLISVLEDGLVRDPDAVVVFVHTCLVADRTLVGFRSFDDLVRVLRRRHPSAAGVLDGQRLPPLAHPHGLHDNDKPDFRQISIVPTMSEALCKNLSELYLPLADTSDGFLCEHPVARLVDGAFRLLRHDMLWQVRANLSSTAGGGGGGALVYANARISKRDENYDDLTVDVEFPVPEGTGRWFGCSGDGEDSGGAEPKWFPKGALVCLCHPDRRPAFFGEITYNGAYDDRGRKATTASGSGGRSPVPSNRYSCTITVAVANWVDQDELREAFRFTGAAFTLVQVCHGFFSYKPVLQALQSAPYYPMFQALVQWPAAPPARVPAGDPDSDLPSALQHLLETDADFAKRFAMLDSVQRRACALPFRPESTISLIQGPPGTGKTFIGTIVALGLIRSPSNKILCVCYSNHQLDQFLESLVDLGLDQVVRLGGRSASAKLSRFSLNEMVERTRAGLSEARRRSESYAETRRALVDAARVIGCTATGAAIFRAVLAQARCNVLLIEEAAELLEAHLLAAVNIHTQRVVMIGDHQQLRPKVNHHDLAVESGRGHDLNRSTFERLVLGGHSLVTLQCQHRMRTSISRIVRRLCYPDLTDAAGVLRYADVRGLRHNVVFVDHQFPEAMAGAGAQREVAAAASTSRLNQHEALLAVKIALHLLKQGYAADDIVVLTPYLGQLHEIGRILATQFRIRSVLGDLDATDYAVWLAAAASTNDADDTDATTTPTTAIRVATVDNFQGEEAAIVIASLVRSNADGRVGFLDQVQRVNVLVSRAKSALILVGNASCLRKQSAVWAQVLDDVPVADGLPAVCPRHRVGVALRTPADFDELAPFGGCRASCDAVLPCGHRCQRTCHDPAQIAHEVCARKHPSLCPAGHRMRTSTVDRRPCAVDVADRCSACAQPTLRKCADAIARRSDCLHCRYRRLTRSLADRLGDQYLEGLVDVAGDVVAECETRAIAQSEAFARRLADVARTLGPQLRGLRQRLRQQAGGESRRPRAKCAACQMALVDDGDRFACGIVVLCLGCVSARVQGALRDGADVDDDPEALPCPCGRADCVADGAGLLPFLDDRALDQYHGARQVRFYNGLIARAQALFQ